MTFEEWLNSLEEKYAPPDREDVWNAALAEGRKQGMEEAARIAEGDFVRPAEDDIVMFTAREIARDIREAAKGEEK